MTVRAKQWPKKNLILGITALMIGIILYASKSNPKNENSAQSLKRAAYVFMGIGGLNIIVALICYILHSCSNTENQPRNSNPINTAQIEPSVHVIAVQEPVTEGRHVFLYNDLPPSYEDAIKNSLHPPATILHVPSPSSYSLRNNNSSNTQVLPSHSPIK